MAPVPPLADAALTLLHSAASTLHPTRTLPHLLNRQATTSTTTTTSPTATVTVLTAAGGTTTTSNTDPDPTGTKTLTGGAIAGIVIGSIAGFLILVWIIRSCTNLGAPPGDEAEPGRPWYGGVRDEYPPRHASRGRSRSRSREYHHHHHGRHHHHRGGSRSRSRRVSVTVPVQEVQPVVVREGSYRVSREERRRSRSRGYYE